MYVCLCDDVSIDAIKKQIQAGIKNAEEIFQKMEISTGCGACRDTVLAIIEENLSR